MHRKILKLQANQQINRVIESETLAPINAIFANALYLLEQEDYAMFNFSYELSDTEKEERKMSRADRKDQKEILRRMHDIILLLLSITPRMQYDQTRKLYFTIRTIKTYVKKYAPILLKPFRFDGKRIEEPVKFLIQLLSKENSKVFSQYNALIKKQTSTLYSFEPEQLCRIRNSKAFEGLKLYDLRVTSEMLNAFNNTRGAKKHLSYFFTEFCYLIYLDIHKRAECTAVNTTKHLCDCLGLDPATLKRFNRHYRVQKINYNQRLGYYAQRRFGLSAETNPTYDFYKHDLKHHITLGHTIPRTIDNRFALKKANEKLQALKNSDTLILDESSLYVLKRSMENKSHSLSKDSIEMDRKDVASLLNTSSEMSAEEYQANQVKKEKLFSDFNYYGGDSFYTSLAINQYGSITNFSEYIENVELTKAENAKRLYQNHYRKKIIYWFKEELKDAYYKRLRPFKPNSRSYIAMKTILEKMVIPEYLPKKLKDEDGVNEVIEQNLLNTMIDHESRKLVTLRVTGSTH